MAELALSPALLPPGPSSFHNTLMTHPTVSVRLAPCQARGGTQPSAGLDGADAVNEEGRQLSPLADGETGAQGGGTREVAEEGGGQSPGRAPGPHGPLTTMQAAAHSKAPAWRKSLAKQEAKQSPRRRLPGGQGRAPTTAFPSPHLQVGVLRLLLPPRRQCCYGDHRYLATKLRCPGHLLSLLLLWGQACVQQPPHLGKRTWWGQAR